LLSSFLLIAMLATTGVAAFADAPDRAFMARLSDSEEVPPVDTEAWGHAVFSLSKGGTELRYRVVVHNIEDVLMAHIHLGPAGENRPVVVWLYPDSPPPQLIEGRFDGVLGKSAITSGDLVGPLEGMTLEDLLDEMSAGNTYVNVHTDANPGGEIRGRLGH
jgi:hypothetical protein